MATGVNTAIVENRVLWPFLQTHQVVPEGLKFLSAPISKQRFSHLALGKGPNNPKNILASWIHNQNISVQKMAPLISEKQSSFYILLSHTLWTSMTDVWTGRLTLSTNARQFPFWVPLTPSQTTGGTCSGPACTMECNSSWGKKIGMSKGSIFSESGTSPWQRQGWAVLVIHRRTQCLTQKKESKRNWSGVKILNVQNPCWLMIKRDWLYYQIYKGLESSNSGIQKKCWAISWTNHRVLEANPKDLKFESGPIDFQLDVV